MKLAYYSTFPDYSAQNFNMEQYIQTYRTSNVIIDAAASSIHYPPHESTLTIKTVFKGEEHYRTKNCRYRVTENNFLLLNAFNEYESKIESDITAYSFTHSFSIFFHPAFVREAFATNKISQGKLLENNIHESSDSNSFEFIQTLYKKDSRILKLLKNIQTAPAKLSQNQDYIDEQIHFLFDYLLKTQNKLNTEISKSHPVKKSTKLELFRRLYLVKDYIESCYNENIKLSQLAKTACMCEHHTLREFRKYFKITPHQYLTRIRLEESRKLLSQNQRSISEISTLVGFEHHSSFSQLFTQRYKISPSAYRKNSFRKNQF
ncbi:MAG: helix-turn-helix transcriptional regulator [Bacteroidetes bacterium]|nr:helix-turn-helix transcriptional regulator [Bacteroidota bacterium]